MRAERLGAVEVFRGEAGAHLPVGEDRADGVHHGDEVEPELPAPVPPVEAGERRAIEELPEDERFALVDEKVAKFHPFLNEILDGRRGGVRRLVERLRVEGGAREQLEVVDVGDRKVGQPGHRGAVGEDRRDAGEDRRSDGPHIGVDPPDRRLRERANARQKGVVGSTKGERRGSRHAEKISTVAPICTLKIGHKRQPCAGCPRAPGPRFQVQPARSDLGGRSRQENLPKPDTE